MPDRNLDLLEKLFDAKLEPIHDKLATILALETRLLKVETDLSKYRNRIFGFLVGGSVGGGAFGTWIAQHLPAVGKIFS